MILFRKMAVVALAVSFGIFVIRALGLATQPDTALADKHPAYSSQEQRLLGHRVDTIVAMDPEIGDVVTLAFPRRRPVIAFLYRTDCPACGAAESTWGNLAASVGGIAEVIAATLDPPSLNNSFLRVPSVAHLHLDLAAFRRAFMVWDVVPITVLIQPSGRVSWARIGPLDDAATFSLLEVLFH